MHLEVDGGLNERHLVASRRHQRHPGRRRDGQRHDGHAGHVPESGERD